MSADHPSTALTRRDCLGLMAAVGLTASLAPLASPAHARRRVPFTYFGCTPIDRGPTSGKGNPGGTWSHINLIRSAPAEGTNALLVAFDHAWLLVDTKAAPLGNMLREHFHYFRGDPGLPAPGLVVNTHHHRDATGGNEAFLGHTPPSPPSPPTPPTPAVPIVAHPKAITRIANQHMAYTIDAQRYFAAEASIPEPRRRFLESIKGARAKAQDWTPETFRPTRAAELPLETIRLGSGKDALEVELHHLGVGHTDNDLVVRLPAFNILHVGDLCFHGAHAFIDRSASSTTTAWIAALGKAIDLCDRDTIVVPGFGEPTGVHALKDQIRYFEILRQEVKKLVDARGQRKDAEALVIERYKDHALPHLSAVACGAVYDEFTRDGLKL